MKEGQPISLKQKAIQAVGIVAVGTAGTFGAPIVLGKFFGKDFTPKVEAAGEQCRSGERVIASKGKDSKGQIIKDTTANFPFTVEIDGIPRFSGTVVGGEGVLDFIAECNTTKDGKAALNAKIYNPNYPAYKMDTVATKGSRAIVEFDLNRSVEPAATPSSVAGIPGPQGAEGKQGPQGPEGPQGPAGEDHDIDFLLPMIRVPEWAYTLGTTLALLALAAYCAGTRRRLGYGLFPVVVAEKPVKPTPEKPEAEVVEKPATPTEKEVEQEQPKVSTKKPRTVREQLDETIKTNHDLAEANRKQAEEIERLQKQLSEQPQKGPKRA